MHRPSAARQEPDTDCVRTLGAIGSYDVSQFGGKQHGVRVRRGFATTADAYLRFVEQ